MRDRLPRLGFLGVGWIGRHRMGAVHRSGVAAVAAVADVDAGAAREAAAEVGCTDVCAGLEELLERDLDGVVIATPTALHGDHAGLALERGVAVFCQKPLGRTAAESAEVVDLARRGDLPLGVDMSYRHAAAVEAALASVRAGDIGEPRVAELVFHNAYGPDRPWARDPALAGGGALIDLGPHLLDLARLFLGELDPRAVHADLFAGGERLDRGARRAEDLALAQITLADGRAIRLACSWWLPAGADAVIEASFIGDGRAVSVRNVDGSFYDFEALRIDGRRAERLAGPPDEWGGRALVAWARGLAEPAFDEDVAGLVDVAALIDRIYGRNGG